ncbi:hypothetical protein JTB14_002816 [Gonioctena quinquepunctata]|nr:hypothetical protein JTB14_002816 [Gonioctena quinquepunctata]
MGNNTTPENREGLRHLFTLADRQYVKNHIGSIPSEPSHYSGKYDGMGSCASGVEKSHREVEPDGILPVMALNDSNITNKRYLILGSDNCCGQIQNRMMNCLYMYLEATKMFDCIEHKFLVVGHSFSAADRNFAIIEKRWKLVRTETLGDEQ